MSVLNGSATADLSVIGQEKSSPGQSQRVYDLPILRKNWVVQSAGKKGRGAPTLTISGGTGYYEHNWSRVDGVVEAIEKMMRDDEDATLSERLYSPSSGSASTRVDRKIQDPGVVPRMGAFPQRLAGGAGLVAEPVGAAGEIVRHDRP